MRRLPQYKWYLASAFLVALGRWVVVAFVALLALSPLTKALPVGLLAAAFIALVLSVGSAVAIATVLRCPSCHKRLLVTWQQANPETNRVKALPWLKQVQDFFLPSEIQGREVRCVHCGTPYKLRGDA
jgi:DNA-directed RNA polymerase subunit RPC12/RpoP